MTAETCKRQINRGDHRWSNFQPCGRPIHQEGLCKRCFGLKRREQKSDAASQKAEEGSKSNYRRAIQACTELAFKARILATPQYLSARSFGDSGYTGKIILDPASLADLIPHVELEPIQPFSKTHYMEEGQE